jgi:hypothetical protein
LEDDVGLSDRRWLPVAQVVLNQAPSSSYAAVMAAESQSGANTVITHDTSNAVTRDDVTAHAVLVEIMGRAVAMYSWRTLLVWRATSCHQRAGTTPVMLR